MVVVNPTAVTVYTAMADLSGCTSTGTTIVGVSSAVSPTVINVTNPSSSVCAGTPGEPFVVELQTIHLIPVT